MNGTTIDSPQLQFRIVIKIVSGKENSCDETIPIPEYLITNRILPWKKLSRQFPGISITRLFTSVKATKIQSFIKKARKNEPQYQPPDFFSYFVITCPGQPDAKQLEETLLGYKRVELAYIQNILVNPPGARLNPGSILHPSYLDAAPTGINASYAWKMKGGDGSVGVKFIDIEQGWIEGHESTPVKTVRYTGINQYLFRDHGAAVLGVIMMPHNNRFGKGIAPGAKGYIISQWRPDGSFNNADAIMTAISHLAAGDILLLEAQTIDATRPGKSWPLEIQEANYQVIRLATALGITVIEAAGNGDINSATGNDLDLFNAGGKKILNPGSSGFRDSGAIIVAASSAGMPHERLPYSNFGARVNCFACGENVWTAGSFPGHAGFSINTYTKRFSGTSSASAIIAGAAILIQSIAVVHLGTPLTPLQLRSVFTDTAYGTSSARGAADKIGVMPDLKKIIDKYLRITAKK